jgi:hypothetical protein
VLGLVENGEEKQSFPRMAAKKAEVMSEFSTPGYGFGVT